MVTCVIEDDEESERCSTVCIGSALGGATSCI